MPGNDEAMKTKLSLALFLGVLMEASSAQPVMDSWVMTDGRMFQAELIQAIPGQLKVRLADGKEETLELSELSALSKKRAAERLGLGGESVAEPESTTTSVKDAAMPTSATAEGPLNLQDDAAIKAAMDTEVTAVGTVKEVATLGSSGHKKIVFDGTAVVGFIGKWNLDKSGDWNLDGLEGKRLQIAGKVDEYNGELQVQVASPNDMRVVELK